MRYRSVAWFALLLVGSAALIAQGLRRDGNWEIKMQMEMPGMPGGMPPMTSTQCITKEDASDPMKSMPQGRGQPSNCKVSDYKEVGNKASWSMKCEGENPMTGTAEVTYTGDTSEGVMKMTMMRGGQAQTMTMKYTGKRLGDCLKSK